MTACLKFYLLKMDTKLGTVSLPCSEGVLMVNHISFLIWALDGRERGSLLRLWCAARETGARARARDSETENASICRELTRLSDPRSFYYWVIRLTDNTCKVCRSRHTDFIKRVLRQVCSLRAYSTGLWPPFQPTIKLTKGGVLRKRKTSLALLRRAIKRLPGLPLASGAQSIRRRSAVALLLGSRVRIPLGAWMFVCCVYMLYCPV
jgi:hypothetical protein